MFFRRSYQKEIMDDMSIGGETLDKAFRELSKINRWLGGKATSLKGIMSLAKNIPHPKTLTILDVGSGGADIVDAVSSLDAEVNITALDFNQNACSYAARTHPSLNVVQGSVMALPFPHQSFDLVHASLFLHHFTEDELRNILQSLMNVTRYGIIINDLRRSLFAYLGITFIAQVLSRSDMVKHDGPLSVRRGFTLKELKKLCESLSSASFTIHRRWAFRWLVCIKKNP
jgi:2-polyprenyl-3-methyl-5-hydroxy-6-metoxy-1,4-benzoquinol methylase